MRSHEVSRKAFCLLSLLLLILVGCNLIQPKQFNVDGAETIPITFEYPFNWDGVYPGEYNGIVVLRDKKDVDFENGFPKGFATSTTAVFITVLSPDQLEPKYGDAQIVPIEILNLEKTEQDVLWKAWNSGDIEEVEKIVGHEVGEPLPENGVINVADFQPSIVLGQTIVDPYIHQLGGREVAITIHQMYSTFIKLNPTSKRWDAIFVVDGQIVRVFGEQGSLNDEAFEKDFYQIIGSLELVNSE